MKLMILANEIVLRVVAPLVGDCDFVHFSGISGAIDALSKEEFDVVLVDSQFPQIEEVCCRIREITPAALLVLGINGEDSWEKAWALDVDGFIPSRIGRAEFMARLKAGFRPCTNRGKVAV